MLSLPKGVFGKEIMDHFIVEGGRPLRGAVRVSGSKNAALPILVATLLTDEPCVLHGVPDLRDIRTTLNLVAHLGKRVSARGSTVRVDPGGKLGTWAPYELVSKMRASFLVAGPLLARFGRVRVSLPGGCAIGLRPIDIHLRGFEALGAKVSHAQGDVVLGGKLKPGALRLRFASVGATQNLMMAAALLPGTTVIRNAAREPENADLGAFLNRMGARVRGAGGPVVRVEGVARLRGAEHRVIPDRIEAGTFLVAVAAAGGKVRLLGARQDHLEAVVRALRRAGARVHQERSGLLVEASGRPRPVSVSTSPYPGFPTDLQAPWMAYMCLARGESRVLENIFEKRFLHAAELNRMGARIRSSGNQAMIEGETYLHGAPVMASDIRAGAALVVAALAARGTTCIQRVYHIDRGYERIERKLRSLGAGIRRVRRLPLAARAARA